MSDPAASSAAAWRHRPEWPAVDVVIPVRNEAAHLAAAVAAVHRQAYAGQLRVIMAVGPSSDDTERVAAELAAADESVVVVANPSGGTAAALNLAIGAGSAPVVVRVDGHSRLSAGYIARAITTMRRSGAVNVGGRQVPVGTTPFERAVATATSSWLGTGGAAYRVGGAEGPTDTVYLGVFDRDAIEAAGLFDERLIRNQDYELNIRLRAAGGTVLFDPELSAGYTPRGTWRALAKQYHDYGRWKAAVMRLHPEATRPRQLVPLAAVAGLTGSALLARRWPLLRLPWVIFVATVSAEAIRIGRGEPRSIPRIAAIFPLIHFSWAFGVARGLVRPDIAARSRSPR